MSKERVEQLEDLLCQAWTLPIRWSSLNRDGLMDVYKRVREAVIEIQMRRPAVAKAVQEIDDRVTPLERPRVLMTSEGEVNYMFCSNCGSPIITLDHQLECARCRGIKEA